MSRNALNPVSSPAPGAPPWRFLAIPALVALAYSLGHLGWYEATPLGQVPVLDERENLDLAEAIHAGALAPVPFYRAPGYALVLAAIRLLGVGQSGLFPAALLLGVVLHAANAALVVRVAGRWFGSLSGLCAGILYALDPVLVHFATQALDNTLALTLFIGGLDFLAQAYSRPERTAAWGWAGILWALATLVRPNFLFVWAVVPILALALPMPEKARDRAVATALASLFLFAAQATWQWKVSGVAGFMPWQGSYNLWSANRPGANGRYFTQQVVLPPELAGVNPARAESAVLYQVEAQRPADDIPAMNAFWRGKFVAEVAGHPLRWGSLMARKAYALLDNFEQYNNKTYVFHKERSPWLRWNPLCWGLLLVLAVAGAARLAAESPRAAWAVGWVTAACTFSVILFYVSDRFRLPLVAIVAVLAGGALGSPLFWKSWTRRRRALLGAGMALTALVTFSSFGDVADTATIAADHVLLARAAFTVGDDRAALAEAEAALAMQPWHPGAKKIEEEAKAELAKKAGGP